jgi:hypothetical protein
MLFVVMPFGSINFKPVTTETILTMMDAILSVMLSLILPVIQLINLLQVHLSVNSPKTFHFSSTGFKNTPLPILFTCLLTWSLQLSSSGLDKTLMI